MKVSVCTDRALELSRRIKKNFSQSFSVFPDWSAVVQYLYPETDWLGLLKDKLRGRIFKSELFQTHALDSLYFFPFLELIRSSEIGQCTPQLDDAYDPC